MRLQQENGLNRKPTERAWHHLKNAGAGCWRLSGCIFTSEVFPSFSWRFAHDTSWAELRVTKVVCHMIVLGWRLCVCEGRNRDRVWDYSLTNYLVKCRSFHLKHSNATIPINKHYSKQKAERARPGTLCSSCLVNSGCHGWMILFHFYQWAF